MTTDPTATPGAETPEAADAADADAVDTDAVGTDAADADGLRPPLVPPLPARRHRQAPTRRTLFPLLTLGATVVAMALYIVGYWQSPFDEKTVWGVLALPLLLLAAVVLARRAGQDETRFDLAGIMVLGFALRGIGTYVRFLDAVDALVYHRVGVELADQIRGLHLVVDTGREIPGTGWIRYVSAWFHIPAFDDMFVVMLAFAFLGWVGCWLCYRAFATAVPDGDHKRYALLLFLWPSLIFWPSSLGKEAWMLLGIGLASWGVSRVLTGRLVPGLTVLVLGLVTTSLVRPHIALMILVGFAVSLFARGGRSNRGPRLAGRIAGVLLLVVGGSVVVGLTAERLGLDRTGTEVVGTALDETEAQTSQGGAAFKATTVRSPLDYPLAFVTVWVRPLPVEAHDGTSLVSSVEGLALVGLALYSWRRLRALPRALIRIPYVTYAATYCAVFVYAFSSIGNFGILARQRTQGLILLFVVLCLPELVRTDRNGARGDETDRERRAERRAATTRRRAERGPGRRAPSARQPA